MAIQVSGTTVIDNDRNANAGVVTATSLDVNPVATTFSPTDGASDVALNSNIVITYNASVSKGSGNITLRDGSASGNVIETIDVTSGSVSVSGGQVTINPSDFPTGKDIYVVVDAGCFTNALTFLNGSTALLNTYNFTTGPITTSSFSPSDGATDQLTTANIVITFSENISKETTASQKYIRIRSGSISGTIQQSIDVSTSAVSISGNQATINPPSDLEFSTDTYVEVEADSFFNADGDADSGNAVILTYNFTTEDDWPAIGKAGEGGYMICCGSNNYWIVAPSNTEVCRSWWNRSDAVTTANSNAACGDWFIPDPWCLSCVGWGCRQYWDSYQSTDFYWSNNSHHRCPTNARAVFFQNGMVYMHGIAKYNSENIRAFRCVSY